MNADALSFAVADIHTALEIGSPAFVHTRYRLKQDRTETTVRLDGKRSGRLV
jgi:hypothetical protein